MIKFHPGDIVLYEHCLNKYQNLQKPQQGNNELLTWAFYKAADNLETSLNPHYENYEYKTEIKKLKSLHEAQYDQGVVTPQMSTTPMIQSSRESDSYEFCAMIESAWDPVSYTSYEPNFAFDSKLPQKLKVQRSHFKVSKILLSRLRDRAFTLDTSRTSAPNTEFLYLPSYYDDVEYKLTVKDFCGSKGVLLGIGECFLANNMIKSSFLTPNLVIATNADFDYDNLKEHEIEHKHVEINDKILNFGPELNKKIKFVKLMQIPGAILQELSKFSHVHQLTKYLAQHIWNEDAISYKNIYFQMYKEALVKNNIATITNKKLSLHNDFIQVKHLSNRAMKFRKIFHEKLKHFQKTDRKVNIWKELKNKTASVIHEEFDISNKVPYLDLPKDDIDTFIEHLVFAVNLPSIEQIKLSTKKKIEEKFLKKDAEQIFHLLSQFVIAKATTTGYLDKSDMEEFLNTQQIGSAAVIELIEETKEGIEGMAERFSNPWTILMPDKKIIERDVEEHVHTSDDKRKRKLINNIESKLREIESFLQNYPIMRCKHAITENQITEKTFQAINFPIKQFEENVKTLNKIIQNTIDEIEKYRSKGETYKLKGKTDTRVEQLELELYKFKIRASFAGQHRLLQELSEEAGKVQRFYEVVKTLSDNHKEDVLPNLSALTSKFLHDLKKCYETTLEKYTYLHINGPDDRPFVSTFIQVDIDEYESVKESLTIMGVKISHSISDIWSVYVPIDSIQNLTELEGILYIELPVRVFKSARAYSNVSLINDTCEDYDGNVIIGIIDDYFDIDHDIFKSLKNSKKRSRIIKVLNIVTEPQSNIFCAGNFGQEIDMTINLNSLSHGTEVASFALDTGKDHATSAHEANVVLVSVGKSKNSLHIINGIEYIMTIAKKLKKVCVINISLASFGGQVQKLYNTQLDRLSNEGAIIVFAAGNYGECSAHVATKDHESELVTFLEFKNDCANSTQSKECCIDVIGQNFENVIASITLAKHFQKPEKAESKCSIDFSSMDKANSSTEFKLNSSSNSERNCLVKISKDELYASHIITIENETEDNICIKISGKSKGTIHMWISSDYNRVQFTSNGQDWARDGDNAYTINGLALTKSVLTIGACTEAGEIAKFSSRGPTIEGIIKPDFVAVGKGGTSFAAPIVVNIITKLLGVEEKLKFEDIKEILRTIADNGSNTVPNNVWGYGKLTKEAIQRYINDGNNNNTLPSWLFISPI